MSTKSEVIFKSKPKVCIFNQGDIVRSKANGLIVMVNANSNLSSNCFAGSVLKEASIRGHALEILGYYADNWSKQNFEPFEGSIALDSTYN